MILSKRRPFIYSIGGRGWGGGGWGGGGQSPYCTSKVYHNLGGSGEENLNS